MVAGFVTSQVRVDLTQEGEQRWREVGAIVFESIRLLQAASDAALLDAWREQHTMAGIKFERSEVGASIDEATKLCLKVHRYGAANALTAGQQLSPNLNVAAVRDVLHNLTPQWCVAVRTSQKFKVPPTSSSSSQTSTFSPSPSPSLSPSPELEKVEPWYGVPYGETPLDSALVAYWANEGPLPVDTAPAAATAAGARANTAHVPTATKSTTIARPLALPQPNPYLPSDLELVAPLHALKEAEQQRSELLRLASGLSGTSDGKEQMAPLGEASLGDEPKKQSDKLGGGGAAEEDYTCTCGDELFSTGSAGGALNSQAMPEGTATGAALSYRSSKAPWCMKHPVSTDPGAFASKGYRHTVTASRSKKTAAMAPANAVLAAAPSLLPPPLCVVGGLISNNSYTDTSNIASDTTVTSAGQLSPSKSPSPFSSSSSPSLWWDLWAKTDATYARPKASLYVALASPVAYDNPALTALMTRLVAHTLQQRLYDADIAGEYTCIRMSARTKLVFE